MTPLPLEKPDSPLPLLVRMQRAFHHGPIFEDVFSVLLCVTGDVIKASDVKL